MWNFPGPSRIFKDIKKIQGYSRNFKDRGHYVCKMAYLKGVRDTPLLPQRGLIWYKENQFYHKQSKKSAR